MLKLLVLAVICRLGSADLDDCCKDPDTTSRELMDDVSSNSPYYAIAVPRTPKTELIDNICYTYFKDDDDELLNIISVVFKNGASEQYLYCAENFQDMDGVTVNKNGGCSFLDYAIDRTCDDEVLILYRCYVSSDTCTDYEVDVGCIPGLDVRIALSTCPINDCSCTDCVMNQLSCDDDFCGNDFIQLPNLLPPQCVTEYNCRDAIRADCAVGEICINECCRLPPPPPPIPPPAPLKPRPLPITPLLKKISKPKKAIPIPVPKPPPPPPPPKPVAVTKVTKAKVSKPVTTFLRKG